ncbi:MAG TPA: alpha/beta fold hydrolase [Polyangiaceae bacterium]|nr:alpha/beta fold hydrolase [Polyangiaceae bacterium]
MTERPLGDFALHGFTGGPSTWLEVAPSATAPWLAGHGPEPWAVCESWSSEVERLAGLAAALPAPRRLLGYSLGGRLSLSLLLDHPALFERAVLVGAGFGLAEPGERELRREGDAEWCRLLREGGLDAFLVRWEAQPLFASSTSDERAQASLRSERRSHAPEGLARSLETVGQAEMPWLEPRLGEVRVPVDWVVGERDEKFRRLAERAVERMPACRLHVIPGAGHNPLVDAPEAVRRILDPS